MMGLLASILANVHTHCVVDPLTALIMDESCIAQPEDRRARSNAQTAVRSLNAHA
jgi:hypothetical protein